MLEFNGFADGSSRLAQGVATQNEEEKRDNNKVYNSKCIQLKNVYNKKTLGFN